MKKDLTITAITIIVVTAICFGIAAMRPDFRMSPTQPFRAKEGDDAVVMRVNGEPVTQREFHLFLAELPQQTQALYMSESGKRELANHLVRLKVLEQEGRRLGGENDPEVSARLEYDRSNILADFAYRKIAGSPDERALRAEYEKRKKSFETIDLSHILIAYQGSAVPARGGTAPAPEAAMRRAREIVARLRQGADFAATAAKESDDQESGAQGGRLGPVPPEGLPPEIARAVAAIPPGGISDPLQTQFGIHIFKVGQKSMRPFEEVRASLTQAVQREKMEQELAKLQQKAKVDLDPGFFAAEKKKSGT